MKINIKCILILMSIAPLLLFSTGSKGNIPNDHLILTSIKAVANLEAVTELYKSGNTQEAMSALLDSIKERAADRYYFNWKDFPELLDEYNNTYPGIFEKLHTRLADAQTSLYAPETSWDLPFKNLKGRDVTPYELRHLARQQKSMDMTLLYYQENKKEYLDYWVRQVADLMDAYEKGEYEDAGNGVFEYYRAGRRIHNWMFNQHAYYASPEYSTEDQEVLLKTFIYHANDLAKRTKKYHPGNHHTKGLVGLFEMAMFLQDFTFSDEWLEQSLRLLTEHMSREINPDGFQFERSVHYHVGDIENYFRVYQLAQINGISIPELFEQRFKDMFEVLKKIAQPDKTFPVLQDDTDHFLKENNELGGIFKAGSLLLEDPELSYFAADHPTHDWFWLLARMLSTGTEEKKVPELGSLALESTGYYIMRSGWDEDDVYMSISAGLSAVKPDHQHGDMLGLTAYAGGYQILPTYQVKYNKPDYYLFKNSWVKNVAIVDSIPHGLKFQGNTGGSGFGKFKDLPKPETILWKTRDQIDLYIGTHNRYENMGVKTYRTVVFLKKYGEWIVADRFVSDEEHDYQQIWQGLDRSDENATLYRQFNKDLNMRIIQHCEAVYEVNKTDFRDKRSWMVSTKADDFQFLTHISIENDQKRSTNIKWNVNRKIISNDGYVVDISKNRTLIFGATEMIVGKRTLRADKKTDLYLEKRKKGKYTIRNISPYTVTVNDREYKPGQTIE
jgi:Heparinase II/III N-terminus/Heparinase II/III-like protein